MSNAVLLISHGFQPSYEKAFANGLARNGIEVSVVTSDRSLITEFDSGIEVIPLRGSQDSRRNRWQKAKRLFAYTISLYWLILLKRFRAIHVTGTFITSSVQLGLLEMLGYRLTTRRLMLTVHNLLPHDRHTRFNKRVLQWVYRIPDTLVVHTTKMREALVCEWGIPASKVIQMEHGVDDLPAQPSHWKPDANGRLRLLMFGSVLHYKGIDIALGALQDFSDFPISLVIAGECRDPILAESVKKGIENVPAMHSVEWRRGFVPEPEVQSVFEAADAVLLPYRHIDQSGVLLTAYRFGLPVLAFDVGSFADYVNDSTGVIVRECTPEGLQQGFGELQARLASLDREAVRTVARNYLWEKTVRVLLAAY